jgi:hypothetical protein
MAMARTAEKPTKNRGKNGGPRENSGGARPGSGRKPFNPTDDERKQVEALSGYGIQLEQIAALIRGGICRDTLYEHFAIELALGKAKANSKIGQTIYQKAISGDPGMLKWWSATQMKWSERHEITGADGGPIKTENATTVTLDPSEAYKRLLGGQS